MLKTEKRNRPPIARFVFCSLLVLLFFSAPSASAYHLKRGLSICFETLIPSLFPFMVISEILVRADIASFVSPMFSKPMRHLFGVSGAGAAPLLLGILCGFPVGAKTCAALYEKGDVSKHDAERLMAFCNLPSAPFMIFAVGENLFGSRPLGVFLYLNAVAVTLACGVIGKLSKAKIRDDDRYTSQIFDGGKQISLIKIFTDSIGDAAGSVICVSAFVCFFTCAVGTLSSHFSDASSAVNAIMFSFFELTSGSAACSVLEPRETGVILAAVASGWSGLSVFFQIYSLSRTRVGDISMKPYLVSKALSALICGVTAAIATRIFPSLIPRSLPDADAISHISPYPIRFISAIDIFFILSLLFYLYKELDRRLKI